MSKTILITGGAGFIGSHLCRFFVTKYPGYKIVNLDKLTYAGNLENLRDIENNENYHFIKGDITDLSFLKGGNYTAEIFQDGVNADRDATDYKKVTIPVTGGQKLNIHLAPGGGWAATIKPVE